MVVSAVDDLRNSEYELAPDSRLRSVATKIRRKMEIKAFHHESKWLLAVGVHMIGATAVAAVYWSHNQSKWVDSFDDGTVFGTKAAALVYRRGNLARMTAVLADLSL